MGRLAYDISTCCDLVTNVQVEANDSSVTMAFAAQSVLKMLQEEQPVEQRRIYPFVSDPQINEIDSTKRFEMDIFPDKDALDSFRRYNELKGASPNLSFTVGDFVSTYSQNAKQGQYDVIATSFFIDTATNIYEYVFIMKHLLNASDSSVWVNCGPVQWHPCAMLRPTVDELRDILEASGFELVTWEIAERTVAYRHPDDSGGEGLQARYTRSEAYRPLRFVARVIRNADADDDDEFADLPLRIQYTEYLNGVASGKVK